MYFLLQITISQKYYRKIPTEGYKILDWKGLVNAQDNV